jgi:hypothetical protein
MESGEGGAGGGGGRGEGSSCGGGRRGGKGSKDKEEWPKPDTQMFFKKSDIC